MSNPKSYAVHTRKNGARKTYDYESTLDRLTEVIRNKAGVKVEARLVPNGLGKDLHLRVDSYADFIISRQIAVSEFGYERGSVKMEARV